MSGAGGPSAGAGPSTLAAPADRGSARPVGDPARGSLAIPVDLGARPARFRPDDPGDHRLLQHALCGYTVNPYRRCDIRCGYCINAAQGASEPVIPADRVAHQLREELAVVPAAATIGIGTVVDAYPNAESVFGITRTVLATVVELDRLFVVVTKSTLVRRDLDLLVPGGRSRVCVSVSTGDPRQAERIEPGAPTPATRLALVRELAAAGVDVSVSIAPWIPDVTDVRALLAEIDPTVPVGIAPLNTTWLTATSGHLARGCTQEQIDARYRAEIDRVGTPANVGWLPDASSGTDDVYRTLASGPVWTEHARRWIREAVRCHQAASAPPPRLARTS